MMVWSAHLVLLALALVVSGVLPVQGVTLSLRGNSIPTDGSGRIVITDINPDGDNDEDALICQSEMLISSGGNWYLHPTQQTTQHTTDGSVRIEHTDSRGWRRNRATVITVVSETRRLIRLRRDDSIASGGRALEGVFTCDIPGDTNTPVSVGIYYPISSVDVTINVVSSRQGTFTVTCIASGGTVVSSSLTGPGGVDLELQPVGSIERTGQNTYSVTSGILSGRSNGDTYQCTAAANLSSPHPSDSTVLRVATDPTIVSLVQVSATAVRVEWSQPSGGASVTGYVVHCSDHSTDRSMSVAASSTSADITGLVNDGRTYSISVEATSEHLSGESEPLTIVLVELDCSASGVADVVIDCQSLDPQTALQCSFNGGPLHPCFLPLVVTNNVSPPGNHSVRIVASTGPEDTVLFFINSRALPTVSARVPPLGVYLVNESPRVTDNSVQAEFQLTRPVYGVRCFLRSQFDRIWQDCTSGSVVFSQLNPGLYVLKIHAYNRRADVTTVKRGFVVTSDPNFCSIVLVNRGVTVSVTGARAEVQVRVHGPAEQLSCVLDEGETFGCESPVMLLGLIQGRHKLEITPLGCGGGSKTLSVRFSA